MSTILHVGSGQTYSTIQDAIAASGQGDTIIVHAGTYHEQVQIDGHTHDGLTIQAAPGNLVFIDPPATIAQTADSPTSGRDIYSLVTVNGADNVTISGLIVDGQQRGAEGEASGGTLAGITYVNADGGLIDHVVVTGIRNSEATFGNLSGVGIYFLNNDPSPGDPGTPPDGAVLNSIEVRDSTVQDFQKAAIVANYGDVNIHDNTIIGHGATTANQQVGIQVSGSTGSIDHNNVTDIGYVDPGYTSASAGIVAFEDRDLVIDHNDVVGTGATDSSYGVVMQDSVGGAVTDNHVSHVGWGVDVEDTSFDADPMVPGGTPGFTYDYSSNTISEVGFNSAYFAADPVSTDAFHVVGTDGNDVITTGGGDDLIVGGNGDGNDIYDGGTGTDTVDYSSATNSLTVDLTATDRSGEAASGGGTVGDLLVNAGYADNTPVGKATGTDIGSDALINIENVIGGHAGDDITGDANDNVIVGGGGDDSLDSGAGTDTALYAASIAAAAITINAGSFAVGAGAAEGGDTLTNIERVHSAAANDILLVGNGGYASIQDAIDAAQNGDTIVVAAGTYSPHLIIDKDVTIVGPNGGIPGTGARGDEAVITGGIEITADGVILDGLKIDGSHVVTTAVTDAPNGIFINASHVAVENSILTGDVDSRPFSTTGSVTDLDFSHNSVSGWSEGAYITAGATGSIDHNEFTTNGNDIVTESVSMTISNNSFEDSVGSHIAAVPFDATVDLSSYILDSNTFSTDRDQPISIYPNHAGPQTITGTDFSETFRGNQGLSPGPFTFEGGGGADKFFGSAGVDTASYASSSAGVSINLVTGVGHGGDAEGDTLSGIENVIGSSHNDAFVGDASANVFTGGDGNDVYTVSDSDTVVEVGGSAGGIDEVRSAQTITLAASVENLTLIDGVSDVQSFDNLDIGPITDGEQGWQVNGPNAPRDQTVVDFGGGNHKFRMSSDPAVGDFAGPYSPELSFAAGEHATGASFDGQSIDFDFQAVNAAGDGSRIEVDFGIASGQDRNNFLVLESFVGGIRIAVSEPDTSGDFSGNGVDPAPNDWRQLTSGVDASVQHHLTMKLHYIDGPDNDVIQVFLDDNLIGTTTTFENFRDAIVGTTHGGNTFDNLTDRVFFRPSANGAPNDGPLGQNQGFYFDNLETAVYNIANVNGTGNGLANVITGNSGDNVLTGLAGNDFLDGGAGNDTAAYIATLTPGSFQYDFVNGHWTVASAADGTDTLTSIGNVTDGSPNKFFLVSGDSDFTTTNSTFASTVTGDTVVTEVSVVEGSTLVDDFSSYGLFGTNLADADAAFFHLDNAGHLVFNAGPDFEAPADSGHDNVYRVQFQTTTGKTVTHVYDIRVTNAAVGAVTDGNGADNTISEAAINGAVVGITASATDGAGSVTYSLTDNAGGRFAIDTSTGVVTVANASLIDFESAAGHSYSITAKASTGGEDASQTFSIAVTNAAPSTPTDSNGAANGVTEGAANGSTVGVTASAADPHGGAVTYILTDNAGGRFAINANTGVVTVANGALLDFEAQTSHAIIVRADDGNGGQSATQSFTINVANALGHTVNGSGGADSINGTHGPTGPQAPTGFATNEEDTIRGKAGNDTIHGLGGNDRLFGDAGNDRLFGDAGNDRLDGGIGTDRLTGGVGIDRFVFKHGYGHDTVFGYTAGTDKIDLSGTGAHGFGGIHLVKNGANVDIHVGSDILTVDHTTIATINAHHGDFLFA